MKQKWWHNKVVYQIYPRSFYDRNGDGIGDIQGIIEKLDYLSLLGIDIIWLSPVNQSPNVDNGYDISDYYSIMDELGTMEDTERLIGEANKRNLSIIMDLVINHTSDKHQWFIESKKSKDNPYRDFYIWRNSKDSVPNDIQSIFGGSAWEYDDKTKEYYFHLFSKHQPDLNHHNMRVRKELYEMMHFWLKKGIKGFRVDVIDLIGKEVDNQIIENGPNLYPYLKEMYKEVLSQYDVVTVGETPSITTELAKLLTNQNNAVLDMVFSFEHMALDEVQGKGKWEIKPLHLPDLKKVLSKWQYELNGVGWNSLYWNNHDQPRIVSRWGNDKKYREESAKMLATVLHFMKGTPFIYQGEEIGMTNISFPSINDYKDIETRNYYQKKLAEGYPHDKIMKSIRAKSRDNARTPMQWDTSLNAGFTVGTPWIPVNPNYKDINVQMAIKDKNSIFHYYRYLIKLRKKYKTIVYGDYELLSPDHEAVFAYKRVLDNEEIIVICNFTEKETTFQLDSTIDLLSSEILISNYEAPLIDEEIILRPYEAIAYLLRP